MKRARVLVGLLFAVGCVPDERPSTGPKGTTTTATELATRAPPPFRTTRDLQRPLAAASSGSAAVPGSPLPAGPTADPMIAAPFADRFDRAVLGSDWTTTIAVWRLEGGRLCVDHAKNHPAWLRKRLPVNARIEFDAATASEDGDIKAEYWGDGRSAAETVSYNSATSYLTIFGGWKNSFHVLARIDEHAHDRPELRLDPKSDDPRARPVAAGRTYHFKVVRSDGRTVQWFVDDLEILSYPDPQPLAGPNHDHFGFNDWDVRLCFDNLTVSPLP